MDICSACVHGNNSKREPTGAVSFPIYQTATFTHPEVGESTGYDYSRLQNPTRETLEKLVNTLENGYDAMAFSTGMAATTTLMELFSPNDHIIVSDDIYGGTHRLFNNICSKNGLQIEYINTSNLNEIIKGIKNNTKAIFIETPTNPMMNVSDINEISKIAKHYNLLLIVDNTFLTPFFQLPLDLGADIVIHSGTKYLSGHNDTLAGFLVVNSSDLSEKLRFIYKTTGACLAPFDSWLLIRGIKTLAIRLQKQQENAVTIANWLSNQNKIKKVYFVGLENHPQFEISKKQTKGFGAMISFEVDKEETAKQILKKINLIMYAESLGGVETLLTYPMLQTHADVPQEEREKKGINEKLLRLSVGIENVDDLINDLKQSME